ncbi:Uncharacterised protein [Exiguobacterium aurantiacum]|uniref:Uncharacterized protein n=2 Tax=Exiguobacterium aurantiacum TaxID=33987 RepID=A0A377FTC8_9BACL|nr:Uncharacterised protein [Exiguobacterium aurantiacum]
MTREAMYRFIQACIGGRVDDVTEEGISFYRRGAHASHDLAPVLDALIERFLSGSGREVHVNVVDLADDAGVRPYEAVQALLALSDIFLVSNYIEERLITIQQMEIDALRTFSVRIVFSAWLSHHLDDVCNLRRHQAG